MQEWVAKHGFGDNKALLDYAYALSTHYGEAIGALSCQMYEATAAAQGVIIKAAEAAATPKYGEVAKAVNGAKKQSEKLVSSAVGRLVKQVGADTTLKNAMRDGAQFAWVPQGDTCAFCLTLASRGWQYMSAKALKGGHAEHIHANCDCQYAVRFDGFSTVQGYDPNEYLEMYNNAEGSSSQEKINSMRRAIADQKKTVEKNKKSDIIKLSQNLFTKRDSIYYDAFSIEEEPGYEDIYIHGSSSSIQINTNDGVRNMTAAEFAGYLKKSTSYAGGDIRLASCETGKGENSFAQQLSKILGVKVKAPDDDVYYIPSDGTLFVGSPTQNIGSWRVFDNGEEIT